MRTHSFDCPLSLLSGIITDDGFVFQFHLPAKCQQPTHLTHGSTSFWEIIHTTGGVLQDVST
jgi:hypothetical protein